MSPALLAAALATHGAAFGPAWAKAEDPSPQGSRAITQQVIAQLDGRPVTAEAFAPYLRAYIRSKLYHSGSPERLRVLADEAIDAFLVDRILAEQAAGRALEVDEAEVEKRLARIEQDFSDRPDWPKIRERLPKLRQEIVTDLRIAALKREITQADEPTLDATRAFYERHPEQFTRPAAYRLGLILISVDPGADAQSWRDAEAQAGEYASRIAGGEAFADLARAQSNHDTAADGGEVGLIHEGQLGEAAEAALRSAPIGGLSKPVRLLEGVALFKVYERRQQTRMPFEEVEKRARALLARQQAGDSWRRHIDTARKRFSVDRFAFDAFLAGALP